MVGAHSQKNGHYQSYFSFSTTDTRNQRIRLFEIDYSQYHLQLEINTGFKKKSSKPYFDESQDLMMNIVFLSVDFAYPLYLINSFMKIN